LFGVSHDTITRKLHGLEPKWSSVTSRRVRTPGGFGSPDSQAPRNLRATYAEPTLRHPLLSVGRATRNPSPRPTLTVRLRPTRTSWRRTAQTRTAKRVSGHQNLRSELRQNLRLAPRRNLRSATFLKVTPDPTRPDTTLPERNRLLGSERRFESSFVEEQEIGGDVETPEYGQKFGTSKASSIT
jgi:hypothetical protein